MASKNIKNNQKLQAQVKMALKRRKSSSSEEDIQLVKLQKKLLETEEKLKQYQRQETEVTHDPSPEAGGSQIEGVDGGDDDQLYGSNYDEKKMVCIGNDVYCRKVIHDMALGSSHKASHIARKLLEGVFKITVLLKATLTGQAPRAQGLQRKLEPVVALCYRARAAIIDFSLKVSKERAWEVQTVKDIERAMSQRLGEIKRQKRP